MAAADAPASPQTPVPIPGYLKGYLALGALVLLVVAAGGPGHRFGLWGFRQAFTVMRYGAYAGGALGGLGLLLMLLQLRRPYGQKGGAIALAGAGTLLCGAALGLPLKLMAQAKRVPPIHDISTDTEDPPEFRAVAKLRKPGENTLEYGGPELAATQAKAYPDIQPVVSPLPPAEAHARCLAAVQRLGFEVVASDAEAGRIEAYETTLWFGFVDDVVIRVQPREGGSRVDVRSISRVGMSDVGANAARIRRILAEAKLAG